MIQLCVKALAFDRAAKAPVVLLEEVGSERVLPIWIGPGEANAIANSSGAQKFPRPLTHDLLVSILKGLGGKLRRVEITRVEDSTYFAELVIDQGGRLVSIDARPSDSIAIALRADAGIYADDAVMEAAPKVAEAQRREPPSDAEPDRMSGEALAEHLRKLRPEDLGRFER